MTMKPKGGYKDPAPYQTTHVRVPVPLKPAVETLIAEYRELVLTGVESPDNPEQTTTKVYAVRVVEIARSILKKKKSARQSLALLLTAVYNIDIDPKTL